MRRFKHRYEKVFQILKWRANRKVKASSVLTENVTRGDRLKLWQERLKGAIKETVLKVLNGWVRGTHTHRKGIKVFPLLKLFVVFRSRQARGCFRVHGSCLEECWAWCPPLWFCLDLAAEFNSVSEELRVWSKRYPETEHRLGNFERVWTKEMTNPGSYSSKKIRTHGVNSSQKRVALLEAFTLTGGADD